MDFKLKYKKYKNGYHYVSLCESGCCKRYLSKRKYIEAKRGLYDEQVL